MTEVDKRDAKLLFTEFENLLQFPSSIAILAELMIKEELSVKDFLALKTVDIKKTVLYQRLSDFEQYQFIYTRKEQIDNVGKKGSRKSTRKLYCFNNEIFESLLQDLFQTRRRDAKLFSLHLQNSFISREIRKLENLSNTEVEEIMVSKDFQVELTEDTMKQKVKRFRPSFIEPISSPEEFMLIRKSLGNFYQEYITLNKKEGIDPISLFSSDRKTKAIFIGALIHLDDEFEKRMDDRNSK